MPGKKASARATAPKRAAAARDALARRTKREEALAKTALATRARRQFQKTSARAIQGHLQARTQRQQARRDSR